MKNSISPFLIILMFPCFLIPSVIHGQSVVTKEKLVNAVVTPEGTLVITPSKNSSQHDFDFFEGSWKIRHKKLKTRLNNCEEWITYEGTNDDRKMLRGIGHTNNNRAIIDGKPSEGVGLTLFNPETRLWRIYWASGTTGVLDQDNPVVGSFENNVGTFYSRDTFNGKPIIVMARWDKTDPDKAVWSQAFSDDNGKSWEWNWYMYEDREPEDKNARRDKLLTFDNSIPIPELEFDKKGDLIIKASPTSSNRDFEFLTGPWKMYHRRLKVRLQNSNAWENLESMDENYGAILNGLGNTDLYAAVFNGEPFEGFTLRLFNPETKLWSLYWVASNSGILDPPVVGSFVNNIGHFFCKDVYKGVPVIVVFRWDKRDPEHPVWSQAFSTDNGKTWEWNWINVSYRQIL